MLRGRELDRVCEAEERAEGERERFAPHVIDAVEHEEAHRGHFDDAGHLRAWLVEVRQLLLEIEHLGHSVPLDGSRATVPALAMALSSSAILLRVCLASRLWSRLCSSSKSRTSLTCLPPPSAELGLPVLDTPMARRALVGPHAARLVGDGEFAAAAARPEARLYSNSENAIGWIARAPRQNRPAQDGRDCSRTRSRFGSWWPTCIPTTASAVCASTSCARSTRQAYARPSSSSPPSGSSAWASTWSTRPRHGRPWSPRLEREVKTFASIYPDQVLGLDRFVVEEVIPGEEFAVDAYFDASGTPVLVDVYAHLFASADDVSDRVYLTNTADDRATRTARDGVSRRGGAPRRAARLPGPRRAAHRLGWQRRTDRGQPDALRRVVRDGPRALRLRREPVPVLSARGVPGLAAHRARVRGANHGAGRLGSAELGRSRGDRVGRLRALRGAASATYSTCAQPTSIATRSSPSPSSRFPATTCLNSMPSWAVT